MRIENGGQCRQDIVCMGLCMHCDTDKLRCILTRMVAEVEIVKVTRSATWLVTLYGTPEPAPLCSIFSCSRSTQRALNNS